MTEEKEVMDGWNDISRQDRMGNIKENQEIVEVTKKTKPNGTIEIILERYKYIKAMGTDFKKTIKRTALKYTDKEKAEKEFERLSKKYKEVKE